MQIINNEQIEFLPGLHGAKKGHGTLLQVKFFTPWIYTEWYLAEYDPETRIGWGWIRGFEDRWGYFNLDELENLQGPYGLKVQRDSNFEPMCFSNSGSCRFTL
ncbi:MAG: hypothetical protein K940chlam9_01689 [Chlamydiae bacterium]|nr:hypothetical protein [Chlamydiota bacterium]